MKIDEAMRADIRAAVDVMRRGGVILYPTDTIWGIGCDARNADAVARVYQIKQRRDSKALICLVDSLAMLDSTVGCVPDAAEQLVEAAVEPITIVYDHALGVAPILLAPDGSAGVRLTREPFSSALCAAMRGPVVSTSANISGHPAPSAFADIDPELLEAVDYVCTSRRDEKPRSKPSTVIKISDNGVFKILRT